MSGSIYNGVINSQTRRAGIVSLEVNGEAIDVASDLTYDATTIKREALIGQSGVQGFSEMPKTGSMSFKVRDSAALSQAAFNDLTVGTANAILANGKQIYGYYLFATDVGEVSTTDGTFSVKLEGQVLESSYAGD